jgi:hypothetical protein
LLIQWSPPSAWREESICFIFSDHDHGNLGFPENERRRKRSRRPCSDQISDVSIHIPDVFIILPDLPVFMTLGLTGSRWCLLFGRLNIFRILSYRFGRKASCSQFFDRHGSCSTFNSSHLFDNSTNKRK